MERLLLKRFKQGDRDAFRAIYEACADSALRLAKVVMKHDKLAEDAVQEAFLRAYTYRKSLDTAKPFVHWLNKILINECKRSLKENQRKWQHLESEAITALGQTDDYAFEKYEALYTALQNLPQAYRIPVTLKYMDDYTEEAIADVLSMSKSTVKSRLYEGRQKLKKSLTRFGYGDDENE